MLNVENSKFKGNCFDFDFIDMWVEVIGDFTDASRELIEASGLFVLSTLIGHRAVIPFTPDAKPFTELLEGKNISIGKSLNLWFLIIGKSRWSRKSTVAGFAEDYLRNVLGQEYIVSNVATPEALVDELSEKNCPWGSHKAWIMDEYAIILESCRRKDYMADLEGVLQKLYDGRNFSRRTRGKGRIVITHPYFTVFAATTPYVIKRRLLDESMFIHGFLNRFIMLWDEGTRDFVPFNERLHKSLSAPLDHKEDIERLVKKGEAIVRIDRILVVHVAEEALRELGKFDKKVYGVGMQADDEITNLYLGSLTDFLLKLAGVYRISRLREEDLGKEVIPIEAEDLERAKRFINHVIRSFKKVREELQKARTIRPKELVTIEDHIRVVKQIVLKYGREEDGHRVIDRTTLYREWYNKTRASSTELNKVLKTLEDMGTVLQRIEPTAGRSKIVLLFREL